MSIYDRMQNPSENKDTCGKCEKPFTWSIHGDHYPGNKMTEYIKCPYCEEQNGSMRTSGSIYSSKVGD